MSPSRRRELAIALAPAALLAVGLVILGVMLHERNTMLDRMNGLLQESEARHDRR